MTGRLRLVGAARALLLAASGEGARTTFTRLFTAAAAAAMASARDACRIHLQSELPPDKDPRHIIEAFKAAVNMSAQELERWLATEESRQAVEQSADEADKDGRHAARRIVELLRKEEEGTGELFYEADFQHMHQITQYINCHRSMLQQAGFGAADHLGDRLERYHLMNFGFDPMKAVGGSSGGSSAQQAPSAL